ncbi:sulfite exporter TauE/SafE family protein [Nitrogeniibacter mangrovi]|uniref:Probable membrane transporter protein n=1 Tax=Nitrogeniibacter mangrovi TaxID=2016596 RepID=A0A6C1B7C2_9RHOO|nr:sulfite exporter TauE/SafE family protein [Nitrogeniibacter mangrovi]
MILAGVLGSAIGAVLGLTGAGGGVLAMPALIMGLGMSLPEAVPVSLAAVSLAAATGAVVGLRRGVVRYRAAGLMALLGVLSAPVGLWLGHRLPQPMLTTVFCALMLYIAVRMLRKPARPADADGPHEARNCMLDPATGRFRWNTRCSATLGLIGCTAGLFTGMLGVGGGFLIVPAFRQFSDLSMQAASATSLAVIALVAAITASGSLIHGGGIGTDGLAFIATTTLGLLLARRVGARLSERTLQRLLGGVILTVALAWLARQYL